MRQDETKRSKVNAPWVIALGNTDREINASTNLPGLRLRASLLRCPKERLIPPSPPTGEPRREVAVHGEQLLGTWLC